MKPGVKLAAFGVVLATAFGGGAALGAVFEPDPPAPEPMEHDMNNMAPGEMMDHSTTTTVPTTTTTTPPVPCPREGPSDEHHS